MRPHGKTKLGFFPLPVAGSRAAEELPCLRIGVLGTRSLRGRWRGIHSFASWRNRSSLWHRDRRQSGRTSESLGIETLQANAMDVRCPPEAVSLLYLNPPYDWECGESNNQRLELVFLEHSYRWLKAGGVLLFVIPQLRLAKCARLLSEHFTDLRVFRLTEPACLQYKQIVVLATRRKRHSRVTDAVLLDVVRYLEVLAMKSELEPLGDAAEVRYEVPASESAVLTNMGIPLDEVEDLLLESAAYRQAGRVLLPKLNDVRGRPLTPLHGGHVGLLCTAGMLNGVFGEGEARHIAHWRSVKFTDHWEEQEEDGTKILHDRERFSQELTLVFADGKTQILTHEKKESE